MEIMRGSVSPICVQVLPCGAAPARRAKVTPCKPLTRVPHRLRASSTDLLKPPDGELGLPILGETLDLVFSGDTFGTSRRQRYGDVYKTSILGAPTVMVYGEEAVRSVLSAEDRLVATDWPKVTSVLVGPDSLNLLTGARHGAVKRALADAFSERAMRQHVPRVASLVQDYVARWAAGTQPLSGYSACQELSQALFDLVVLGGDGGPERAAILRRLSAELQVGFQTPPLELPFTDYGRAVQARRTFGTLVTEALAQCRRRPRGASSGAAPLLPNCALADLAAAAAAAGGGASQGIAEQQPQQPQQQVVVLSDAVIEDNLVAAFFGNASSGPSLAKALQYAAASPEVLQRLQQEQQDIVASYGTEITAEVLDKMSYGAAVAKELLRITPAVPAVFRVAIADFELRGRRIPKGWRVWCHLGDAVLKYNKDAFVPGRWLQPQGQQQQQQQQGQEPAVDAAGGGCPIHRQAPPTHGSVAATSPATAAEGAAPEFSVPFGTGVRMCLGRHLVFVELLVLLAVLARGYDWTAQDPSEEWRLVPAPAPKNGLMGQLRARPV